MKSYPKKSIYLVCQRLVLIEQKLQYKHCLNKQLKVFTEIQMVINNE